MATPLGMSQCSGMLTGPITALQFAIAFDRLRFRSICRKRGGPVRRVALLKGQLRIVAHRACEGSERRQGRIGLKAEGHFQVQARQLTP